MNNFIKLTTLWIVLMLFLSPAASFAGGSTISNIAKRLDDVPTVNKVINSAPSPAAVHTKPMQTAPVDILPSRAITTTTRKALSSSPVIPPTSANTGFVNKANDSITIAKPLRNASSSAAQLEQASVKLQQKQAQEAAEQANKRAAQQQAEQKRIADQAKATQAQQVKQAELEKARLAEAQRQAKIAEDAKRAEQNAIRAKASTDQAAKKVADNKLAVTSAATKPAQPARLQGSFRRAAQEQNLSSTQSQKLNKPIVEELKPTARQASITENATNKIGVTKGADKWVRNPSSIQDQMTLEAAQSGAGKKIINNLDDPAFKGMEKWEYKVKSSQGRDSVAHYVRDPKTGDLMDFKFKKQSTDGLGIYERNPSGGRQ